MRVAVVGLGIQGKKRAHIAANECVATVDPVHPDAMYSQIYDVPLSLYDAALVCTPDDNKFEILEYLLSQGKHVMVEKPLITPGLEKLKELAHSKQVTCYTAYNHRFEPHFIRMRNLIKSGQLGNIYSCRMFYGNGTARDVKNSPWRDRDMGVLKDLGSHLLDTILFWFGEDVDYEFRIVANHTFENKSLDHAIMISDAFPFLNLEMSLLSWRNHFTCDVIAEKGSAHIESLCKWGPSLFTQRDRKLPSGRPNEEQITLIQPDPTWEAEYRYFKQLCTMGKTNLDNDILIHSILEGVSACSLT